MKTLVVIRGLLSKSLASHMKIKPSSIRKISGFINDKEIDVPDQDDVNNIFSFKAFGRLIA
jgi:hypothetical protein